MMEDQLVDQDNLRTSLVGRTFRFSRTDQSHIGTLTLSSDGTISGYHNDNEKYWDVLGGTLVFQNPRRNVTTEFVEHSCESNRLEFRGVFLPLGPEIWHVLSEKIEGSHEKVGAIGELLAALYGGEGPCDSADPSCRDEGYPHTHILPDVIACVLEVIEPRFWLELGSMIGGSALRVADAVKRTGAPTNIVCVDPFTGDVNMWAWEQPCKSTDQWRFLNLKNGRPTIYDRFVANISCAGHADVILPISATSIVGLKLMERLHGEGRLSNLPDVIYLDSAHEPDETFLELQNCWKVLKPGGVLFGDDWDWEAVRNDVRRFAQTIKINEARCGLLRKRHPHFAIEDGILLDRGQWVLAK